jgi:hypothetical protein
MKKFMQKDLSKALLIVNLVRQKEGAQPRKSGRPADATTRKPPPEIGK